jgi:hypothetical protein
MGEERDYIYLKGTEELGEVIDALKEIEAKEIVMVVPRNTKCFLNSTNLSLFKQELNKLRKKVYIDSDDERIINLCQSHGIEIFLSEYGAHEVNKIVTDILPPQKSKIKIIKKSLSQKTESNFPQTTNHQNYQKDKKTKNKTLSIVFLIILALGGGFYFILNNYLNSATLVIKLKTEKYPIDELLTLSANNISPDLEKGVLPAEYIEINKNHSLRQKTTGIKSGTTLPSGRVKIINADDQNPIALIAGTRIQAANGNIYRMTERVNLAPQEEKEVSVFAEKNDSKYYLEDLNTQFTIPGLKGTYWEDKLQVKLVAPIIVSDKVNFVTLDDINEGKTNLEKSLNDIIKQELKLKYTNYIFPEEIGVFDFKILNVSHSVGQQTDQIILTGSASLKTIGVKESKLKEFLKDVISKKNLSQDLNLKIVNLKIDSIKMNNLDLKNKEMLVDLKGEIEIKGEVDSKKILAEIAGQSLSNVNEILNKYPQIEKAELNLFPSWLNKVPVDISKINVKIK